MPASATAWAFCHEALPHVSRTFALTVPVLPLPLSDTVCCAYLMCRAADTIEDRVDLPLALRDRLYDEMLALFSDGADPQRFVLLWPHTDELWLQRLMTGIGQVLEAWRSLQPPDRQAVQACVVEMIDGMRRLGHSRPDAGPFFVSGSVEELERYCHYVAGTVGLMLTRLFNQALDIRLSESEGHRFGLGLQLTNILKDHEGDVGRGTSFIPRSFLNESLKLRPEYRAALIERTLGHLEAAHAYTLSIPTRHDGVRLFCLWALWMAVATLREVGKARGPHPKISRVEVARVVAQSRAEVRDDARLDRSFRRLLDEARKGLPAGAVQVLAHADANAH
ncbi:MAG TPA: squalene/phytoene synthase family protein [Candidatus Xenobia bacterium]